MRNRLNGTNIIVIWHLNDKIMPTFMAFVVNWNSIAKIIE